ncbi:MAG: hypothetical protein ACRC2T_07385 [Thermoguttaceae bacterium]
MKLFSNITGVGIIGLFLTTIIAVKQTTCFMGSITIACNEQAQEVG